MQIISQLIDYFNNPASIWMGVGVLLLCIELFAVPGIGLVFIGLGAITTGAFIYYGYIGETAWVAQSITGLITTVGWAAILWYPIKMVRKGKEGKKIEYKNMIGERAMVTGNQLEKSILGQVEWSGTNMRARLSPDDSHESLASGTEVEIVGVKGTTLIVKSVRKEIN